MSGKVGRPLNKVKWWKTQLNRIVKDERLSPNRRMLATLIGMRLDAEQESKEQALYTAIILGEFVNRKGMKLFDLEDDARLKEQEYANNVEKETKDVLDGALSDILGGGGREGNASDI